MFEDVSVIMRWAPVPHRRRCVKVTVSPEDMVEAMGASTWWSESKASDYGRGHTSRARPSQIGCIGEKALAALLGAAHDAGYMEGGDGGVDVVSGGVSYDVKTAQWLRDDGFILATDLQSGGRTTLGAETRYVFAYIGDSLNEVVFVGWLTGAEIEKRHGGLVKGKGDWYNYSVPLHETMEMHSLWSR